MESFFRAFHDHTTVAMLEWLSAWNVAHRDDPVRFYGFDVQDTLPQLLQYLREAGVPAEELAACETGPCSVASADPGVQLATAEMGCMARRRLADAPRQQKIVEPR